MEWIGFFTNLRALVVSFPIEIFILIGVMLFLARIFSGKHMKRLRKEIKRRNTMLEQANKKGKALVQKLESTHQKSRKVYQLLQQADGNLSAERQSNQEILDELEDAQAEVKRAYRLLNQAEDKLEAEREARLAEARKSAVLVSVIQQLGEQSDGASQSSMNDFEMLESDYITDHDLPAGLQGSQENFTQKIQAFFEGKDSKPSKAAAKNNTAFDFGDLSTYDKQKRKPNDDMHFIADDMWSGSNGNES